MLKSKILYLLKASGKIHLGDNYSKYIDKEELCLTSNECIYACPIPMQTQEDMDHY